MTAAISARKNTLATRHQLVDAAERLFAERGIDNVTQLDITRAAGQKNRNALQYHFSSRQELIDAVLDKHSETIARFRRERLAVLEEKKRVSLHELVEVLVLPVAAMLDDADGGVRYIKINSQLMASDAYAGQRVERVKKIPEAARLEKLLARQLGDIDSKVLRARLLLIDGMLFHGLASYASRPIGVGKKMFMAVLIDSIAAVLAV